MKAKGEFVFKTLEFREAGEFTVPDKGLIKYGEAYNLKVDQILDNGKISEYKFTIKLLENEKLIEKLKTYEMYEKIFLIFDCYFYYCKGETRLGYTLVDTSLE